MGTANYYLKVIFPRNVDKQKVHDFFVEGEKAYDYWQDNRGKEKKETIVFWKEFTTQFPLVSKMISDFVGGDKDNPLAGELDIVEPDHCIEYTWEGDVLYYCAEVWHLASWDRLCNFLYSEFQAESNWLSDEYVSLWNLLEV